MPQTFYIENDEEIISVIGRLRKSSSKENFFVFPKRALVLQSIVNLRLFQREAEKLGKRIVIVTQDDTGKALAEKAGLQTERYSDDFANKGEHLELTAAPAPVEKKIAPEPNRGSLRSNEIGSSDFYAAPSGVAPVAPSSTPLATAESEGRSLRIRNASPERSPSLNSKRAMGDMTVARPETPTLGLIGQVDMNESPAPLPVPAPMPITPASYPAETRQSIQTGREERLKNFFSNGTAANLPSRGAVATPKATPVTPSVTVAPHKAGSIFLLIGGVSALSIVGVLFFLFLPKAEIHAIPYRSIEEVDLQFEGKVDVMESEGSVLQVRMIEKEQEAVVTSQATGTSLGTSQKARGTLVISNAFSADAQSLVATTRFETAEGKVFRLTEGVTVPGMKDGKVGTVEASVMADQTGIAYNIAPSSFKIPGFKGSPKYDKFSGQSSKSMAGGSDGNGSVQTVISKADLDAAATEAMKQARDKYKEAVKSELQPGERILEENLDIVSLEGATLPLAGTAASSFEYKNRFKIRGFVFSEDAIRQKIVSEGEETVGGIVFRPVSSELTYGEAVPDYDAKIVRLKTHARITSESVIDREELLEKVLGQDIDEVNALLEELPEIKKIQIDFKPSWFSSSVPDNRKRVTVFVEPGEE